MTEQKKYMDIVRSGKNNTHEIFIGDNIQIVVQEKLDGANASFKRIGNEVLAFSRNTLLTEENTLGGFYHFVHELDKDIIPEGKVFFGEWLNPHKVKYEGHEKTFWLFDVWDEKTRKYIHFKEVKEYSKSLKLNLIPVLYEGEFLGYDHLNSLVGITKLNGKLGEIETGEGIVVKQVDYLNPFDRQQFVKIVTDKFSEVRKHKNKENKNIPSTPESEFVDATVTENRVEKFIYKFLDEGILNSDFGLEDMGTILKHMNKRLIEDILKEESDLLPTEYDSKLINKKVSKLAPVLVKKILLKDSVK